MLLLSKLKRQRIATKTDRGPCWYCKHEVPARDKDGKYVRGCEWSINRRPVPGWTAKKQLYYKNSVRKMYTYRIDDCPKFELETRYRDDD